VKGNLTGRRRIGKTSLARLYAQDNKALYLFISKKDEVLLCKEFTQEIQEIFDVPVYGEIGKFKDLFELLLKIGEQEKTDRCKTNGKNTKIFHQ